MGIRRATVVALAAAGFAVVGGGIAHAATPDGTRVTGLHAGAVNPDGTRVTGVRDNVIGPTNKEWVAPVRPTGVWWAD